MAVFEKGVGFGQQGVAQRMVRERRIYFLLSETFSEVTSRRQPKFYARRDLRSPIRRREKGARIQT
jgi:hypothetical protein